MAFLDKNGLEHLWAHILSKLGTKVDKVDGKGLSTNDYTIDEKNKLANIEEGANRTIVDSALSNTSTNPVQNQVVNSAISDLNTLIGDTSVSDQITGALTNLGALPLSGGTMTGALNFKNGTWNNVGDDCALGDSNQAGKICIKGLNGDTGIYFAPYNGSTAQTITANGSGTMTITGTVASAFSGNLRGNADTATNISSATPILSTGIENNAITIKTNENGSLGYGLLAMRTALDFQWYDTNWQVGNLRTDGSDSVGFGFAYSNDGGLTYTLKSYVDIDGNYISNALTATAFNSNRSISLTGAVAGSASSNGSNGWSIPTEIAGVTIDNNFSTQYRTQIKGDTNHGNFLKVIRNNTASVSNAPQFGSGLGWGREDTQGYLYVSHNASEAYIGGGNADKLNWTKSIAFSDGTGASGTWGISITGSSGSCTGNSVTATSLATARTLTIGNTSKTFDGSNNVSWSLSEIGAAASSHTHNYAGSSSAGGAATSADKVNTNLIIKLNGGDTEGTNLFTFNGSSAKTINITASSIGAAAESHGTHVSYGTSVSALGTSSAGSASTVSRSDHVHALPALTSCTGILTVAKGGTGATDASGALKILGAYPQADMVFVSGGSVQTTSMKYNGKTIYRKIYTFTDVSANGQLQIETGLGTTLDTVFSLRGTAVLTDQEYVIPLPYCGQNANYLYGIQLISATAAPKINIVAGAASISSGIAILEYTIK